MVFAEICRLFTIFDTCFLKQGRAQPMGTVPLLLLGWVLASAASVWAAEKTTVYIGTYTRGDSEGIYRFELDRETGEISEPQLAAKATNPSFVAIHPNRKWLYSVGEIGDFAGQSSGSVSAFAIQENDSLKPFNTQASRGGGPCYVMVNQAGTHLLVANYGGGSVAVLPIAEDGSLKPASDFRQHEGSSVNPSRQTGPHAHSIHLDPAQKFAFAVDLGLDKIMIYEFQHAEGKLGKHDPAFARVPAGGGPRHFAFHPSGEFAFANNELTSSVTVFRYDAPNGALHPLQTVSTLPAEGHAGNSTAEIVAHPNGEYVYVSNRGHNSIAIFKVDPKTRHLTLIGNASTRGEIPRNFAIDPSGKFLLAANQNSHNVVVFRVDQETGLLEATGQEVTIPNPVCVRFLNRD